MLTTREGVSVILHRRGAAAWEKATKHPMVAEIGDGTLPHAKFGYYFTQNILYLEDYVRAISLCAAKAPDVAAMRVLLDHAQRIARDEISANQAFLKRLGGDPSEIDSVERMAPTTYAYTRHLLHVASQGDCAAGLTAILPCQWSYGELGKRLVKTLPNDPIYSDWISVFGNDEYDAHVAETTGLLDRLANPDDEHQLRTLSWIFDISTRYEVEFWDMAYKGPGALG